MTWHVRSGSAAAGAQAENLVGSSSQVAESSEQASQLACLPAPSSQPHSLPSRRSRRREAVPIAGQGGSPGARRASAGELSSASESAGVVRDAEGRVRYASHRVVLEPAAGDEHAGGSSQEQAYSGRLTLCTGCSSRACSCPNLGEPSSAMPNARANSTEACTLGHQHRQPAMPAAANGRSLEGVQLTTGEAGSSGPQPSDLLGTPCSSKAGNGLKLAEVTCADHGADFTGITSNGSAQAGMVQAESSAQAVMKLAAAEQPQSRTTPTKPRRHRKLSNKSAPETVRTSRDFQRSSGSQLLSQRERVLASTIGTCLLHDFQ